MNDEDSPINRERALLEQLLMAHVQEQRRARRWGILFKSLGLGWLFLIVFWAMLQEDAEFSHGAHTALLEIRGVVGSEDGVIADSMIPAIASAFEDKHTKGVVLRCNSPGGSPVQAGQINDEIVRQRGLHPNIPVYAVVDDLCASGGYYIIAAADRIYVDKASLVGSIGVRMDGFGFTGLMDKLGVERRLLTAGENKGFMDPFSPLSGRQVEHARDMLGQIHDQFIQVVRQGRGNRLQDSPDLFSGLVWNGSRSIEMGLADALGSLDSVARDVIGAEEILDYTPQQDLADRLANRLGAGIGSTLKPLLETALH